MTKKILVYGFYGIENAGNEAMLRAFMASVCKRYPDVEFVVANRHPNSSYDQKYGVRSIQNLEHANREEAAGKWLRGLNPGDSSSFFAFLNEVSECDLIVIGPGQFLVETGEKGLLKGALAQFSVVAVASLLSGVPCYGLALACEPLRSSWSISVVGRLLNSLDALTFRDPRSVENLVNAGIEVPKHQVLGDLALAGQPAPTDLAEKLLVREKVPAKQGARLAYAPRNIYWLGLDQDELRVKMADVLSKWLEVPDRDVLVISQNIYHADNDRDDDREEGRKVIECLPEGERSRVHLLTGGHDPAETEALYGLCDVTFSARLHGSVFSCKQGTPPVVLAFMDKARGFFERVNHTDCLIDLDESADRIAEKLEQHLGRREDLSRSILSEVAKVRETADEYGRIAVEILERKKL